MDGWPGPRRLARALLGPARYAALRALVRGEPIPAARVPDGPLRARFKAHIIESLRRQRMLARELARLKHPALHRPALDVTADIVTRGALSPDAAGAVSVVITNYNYRRFLPVALRSVLAQVHRPLEVLIVDDASTDGSDATVRRLLDEDCPVPSQGVLLKHNVGPAAGRNLGVRLARGRYVFILDADNHLLRDCLAEHVGAALATGADAVYGQIRMFGSATSLLSAAPFSGERLAAQPYIDAMALFRRAALLEAGLYSVDPVLEGWEDYELWLRFASQGRKVEYIPRVLSHYRAHEQSMLAMTNLDTWTTRRHLIDMYPDLFRASARPGPPAASPPPAAGEPDTPCGCGPAFAEVAPGGAARD